MTPVWLSGATPLRDSNTCRSNAQHGFFFGTEIFGTMPTLGDSHSSNFAGNVVNNGSYHPPPMGSVASDIGSVSPDRLVGALHPTVVSRLEPFIGSIASNIGSVF